MSVTFERSFVSNECIDGTHMSLKGMQLMVSTGIPSVDQIFGGGLPMNSITIIEEDNLCHYSTLMAKCFVADSVDNKHKTIISSQTISSKRSRLLKELPIRSTHKPKPMANSSEDIRIAWRYKSQPLVDNNSAKNQNQFDLSLHIVEYVLMSAPIEFCSHDMCLDFIKNLTPNDSKSVTRILIEGLGSPLSPMTPELLPKFIFKLKLLIRKLPNVLCLITLNSQLVLQSNYSFVRNRLHNIVDGVVQLISFDERTVTPYTEYEGLFNIIKLSKINTFNYYSTPETLDLGFQLKNNNRFLTVDKLCLPPDLSETVSRTTGCGTVLATGSTAKSLEF